MFETSVVHTQMQGGERKAGLLTLSLGAHGLVVMALVLAGLRSTSFPLNAPKEMAYPLFALPVLIPPALGSPAAPQHHAAAAAPAQPVAAPTQPPAPQTIPDTVQPLAASTVPEVTTGGGEAATSAAAGEGRGVPWGSENGVGVEGPPAIGTGQTPDAPLPVTGDVKAPVVLHRVQPLYPRVALMGRMNGTVIVQCIIDRNGLIRDVRVVRSTFGAFEQPATDAVRQWIFTPGSLHGQPVDTIFELTVSFRVTP